MYWFAFGWVVGVLTLMSFEVVRWEIVERRAERRMLEPLETCPTCGMPKYRGAPCDTCRLFADRRGTSTWDVP
jgi:hypothetical protein